MLSPSLVAVEKAQRVMEMSWNTVNQNFLV